MATTKQVGPSRKAYHFIREEVPHSNRGLDTNYLELDFTWFSSVPPDKFQEAKTVSFRTDENLCVSLRSLEFFQPVGR
jgi:hypothetical protein